MKTPHTNKHFVNKIRLGGFLAVLRGGLSAEHLQEKSAKFVCHLKPPNVGDYTVRMSDTMCSMGCDIGPCASGCDPSRGVSQKSVYIFNSSTIVKYLLPFFVIFRF